jgi:Holliday junction resolvase RusA-like endonuclease
MTISLPWSMVLHDNHRLMPIRVGKGVRLSTSPEYRAAKEQAEWEIKRQWRIPALKGDVILHAKAYFPNKRKRDAGNYRKLITDAMSGICYADDSQLRSETWERAGFTKDEARIEITLEAA